MEEGPDFVSRITVRTEEPEPVFPTTGIPAERDSLEYRTDRQLVRYDALWKTDFKPCWVFLHDECMNPLYLRLYLEFLRLVTLRADRNLDKEPEPISEIKDDDLHPATISGFSTIINPKSPNNGPFLTRKSGRTVSGRLWWIDSEAADLWRLLEKANSAHSVWTHCEATTETSEGSSSQTLLCRTFIHDFCEKGMEESQFNLGLWLEQQYKKATAELRKQIDKERSEFQNLRMEGTKRVSKSKPKVKNEEEEEEEARKRPFEGSSDHSKLDYNPHLFGSWKVEDRRKRNAEFPYKQGWVFLCDETQLPRILNELFKQAYDLYQGGANMPPQTELPPISEKDFHPASIDGYVTKTFNNDNHPILVEKPGGKVNGTAVWIKDETRFRALGYFSANDSVWAPCKVTLNTDTDSAVHDCSISVWGEDHSEAKETPWSLETFKKNEKKIVTDAKSRTKATVQAGRRMGMSRGTGSQWSWSWW